MAPTKNPPKNSRKRKPEVDASLIIAGPRSRHHTVKGVIAAKVISDKNGTRARLPVPRSPVSSQFATDLEEDGHSPQDEEIEEIGGAEGDWTTNTEVLNDCDGNSINANSDGPSKSNNFTYPDGSKDWDAFRAYNIASNNKLLEDLQLNDGANGLLGIQSKVAVVKSKVRQAALSEYLATSTHYIWLVA